ncbi:MAG: hypothetical protein QGH76_02310 [Phycisphaerales bacterium]|jgi:hypothetical protein|nr:hypothetical protein [Phycisphaerales bacterium]
MQTLTTMPIDETIAALGGGKRAEGGVRRVAERWQEDVDGAGEAFRTFCETYFVTEEDDRRRLLDRFETALTVVQGHLYEIGRHLRRWTDLRGEDMPGVDDLMAKFDPCPDLSDQLYRQQLAFVALLNFDRPDLDTMIAEGGDWSADRWAEVRAARAFGPRIPADINELSREVEHAADMFVSEFHVPVEHMIDEEGDTWFEKDRKLIAHWIIREEIKAGYSALNGLRKQRAVAWVMARHIDGTIPTAIMDGSADGPWDPYANTIGGNAPGELVGPQRYEHILEHKRVADELDPLYPEHPTAIDRKFGLEREIPEDDVESLMLQLLAAPVRGDIAQWLAERLGRPLESHDIYLEDVGENADADELDTRVTAMFPDEVSFQQQLPTLLRGLGFNDADADFLGERVRVEIARGAGHAMRPGIPEYTAWLRTNRLADRLGWDGFDTAMHELGHNLEQLISTHFVPRPLLRNVPNTACTEAFAFLYQSKAKRVIGLADDADEARDFANATVETMLAACQIAGPSLVELYTWRWIYDHPDATPEQLRDRTIEIADNVWANHYAKYYGDDPYHILAAYQHMVGYPLYLADYTLGHIISHQIRSHMRGRDLAAETRRICSIGRLTPDLWMKRAVGSGISAESLANDATDGLSLLRG